MGNGICSDQPGQRFWPDRCVQVHTWSGRGPFLSRYVHSNCSTLSKRVILTALGVLFYLSKWYTKKELNLRMSIFYSGSLISGAFGNLIAAGILKGLGHSRGLAPWQWLYIIEGAITVFVGIIVCIVLPDFPDTWRSLAPELRAVANRRLAIEAAEADVDEAGGMSQLKGFKVRYLSCPKLY